MLIRFGNWFYFGLWPIFFLVWRGSFHLIIRQGDLHVFSLAWHLWWSSQTLSSQMSMPGVLLLLSQLFLHYKQILLGLIFICYAKVFGIFQSFLCFHHACFDILLCKLYSEFYVCFLFVLWVWKFNYMLDIKYIESCPNLLIQYPSDIIFACFYFIQSRYYLTRSFCCKSSTFISRCLIFSSVSPSAILICSILATTD